MALTALKQDSLSDLPWVHSSWSFGSPSPRCFSLPNSVAELVLCSVCSRIRISSKTENKLHTAYKASDAFSGRSPRLPQTLLFLFLPDLDRKSISQLPHASSTASLYPLPLILPPATSGSKHGSVLLLTPPKTK